MLLRPVIMLMVVRRVLVLRVLRIAMATPAVGLGGRRLGQKLLPAVLTAKVERLTVAFSVERRRLGLWSWVCLSFAPESGMSFQQSSFTEANARDLLSLQFIFTR